MENLIIPILNNKENKENKENEEEYNNLIKYISKFLFSESILVKIFNENSVFDNKNIKIIYEIIYSILVHLKDKKDITKDFINIYKLITDFDEDSSEYIINGNDFNAFDDEKKKKDKLLYIYYSYELIYKLIKIKDSFIELLINKQQISYLFKKINSNISTTDTIKIIYDIILYLINNCYQYTKIKKGNNSISRIEIEELSNIFYQKKESLYLYKENKELFLKIIKILQYNNKIFTERFNQIIIVSFFKYYLERNQITQILDLLYEIINIQDEYLLNRLNVIMGYPQMIVKQQNINDQENDENEDEDKNINKTDIRFWPLFG